MTTVRLAEALALMCAALMACGGASAPAAPTPLPTANTLTVNLIVRGTQYAIANGIDKQTADCKVDDGLDDVAQGGGASVKDQAGTVIGAGTIVRGVPPYVHRDDTCRFAVSMTLPPASFYSITLGHQEPVVYSDADLRAKNWVIDLSVGPSSTAASPK